MAIDSGPEFDIEAAASAQAERAIESLSNTLDLVANAAARSITVKSGFLRPAVILERIPEDEYAVFRGTLNDLIRLVATECYRLGYRDGQSTTP